MNDLTGQAVGFIGTGLMGRPMALNLHCAGATVTVHNRSRAAIDALVGRGLRAADSAGQAAAAGDFVILMLTDTAAVDAVLGGSDGVLAGLRPGALVIDMGSTSPLATHDFAARVAEAGGEWLDAPVSGGVVGAEAATLSIMAGGSVQALERARPLLSRLGARITHVGPCGCGQIAKTANQMIVGLTIGAVAEALALAGRAGADLAHVRAALAGGFADSRILELHGLRMIDGDFTPGGRISTQHKDLLQALELAEAVGLHLPATELNRRLYAECIAAGDAGLDHSGLYRYYTRSAATGGEG